jgi:hypothetical protein
MRMRRIERMQGQLQLQTTTATSTTHRDYQHHTGIGNPTAPGASFLEVRRVESLAAHPQKHQ